MTFTIKLKLRLGLSRLILARRAFSVISSSRRDSPLFVTTPIYYVNSVPHIGHLYTSVLADAWVRFQLLRPPASASSRPLFSTGTDEHGMKIERAAKAAGEQKTILHCDKVSAQFRRLSNEFGVDFTDFVRTTEDRHFRSVQSFWEILKERGHLYKSEYQGWYSLQDEAFVPESQIKEGHSGQKISIESGHPVEFQREENYLFRLSQFVPEVKSWIEREDPVRPTKFRDLLLHWISEGFTDLSVSRPASRLSWGIPVPGDEEQRIYVWLDALVNYLTAAGFPEKPKVWPPTLQVVGKDILKFHGIYWPAFLIAAGLDLPKQIFCHSHWTVEGKKMSKSLGNVVDPFELAELYGTDGVRYFLLREGTPQSDANFTREKMHRMLNAELADTLGNLLSRCGGKVVNPGQKWPEWEEAFEDVLGEHGTALKKSLESLPDKVETSYSEFMFYRGLEEIMKTIRLANLYVEETKPWVLAKTGPESPTLLAMLSVVFETLRVTSVLMLPIIPNLSTIMLDRLNVDHSIRNWDHTKDFAWNCKTSSQIRKSQNNLGPSQGVFYRRVKL